MHDDPNKKSYETDLHIIDRMAAQKEEENDHFLQFVQRQDSEQLDAIVHQINKEVSEAIDCTTCGNCCKTLVVNITAPEIRRLGTFLNMEEQELREKYIEESLSGSCFINTVPCHFLSGTSCSIYPERFTECRDFPHLHKPGFAKRLLGTLLHYPSCPIIYNVLEEVKRATGFIADPAI